MTRPFASFPFSSPASLWRVGLIAAAVLGGTVLIIILGLGQQAARMGGTARRIQTVAVAMPTAYQTQEAEPAAWTALPPPRRPAAERLPLRSAMLVRTGSMQLRVDSLASALARAESIAVRLDAIIAASTASGGSGGLQGAALTIRVASGNWDRLLAGLARLGQVERLTTEAQDVGEEYVDVEARLANGRRLEARLLDLLASRTGKLEDILAAETELARVREGIESLEGRRRYLAGAVARSTLRVDFVSGVVGTGIAEAGLFRDAASEALRSFLLLLAFLVRVSGIVVPVLVVAVAGWSIHRRYVRAQEAKVLPIRQLNVS